MSRKKAKLKSLKVLTFLFAMVLGINAIGSAVLSFFEGIVWTVMKIFSLPFILLRAVFNFIGHIISGFVLLLIRYKKHIFISLIAIILLFSFAGAYYFVQSLPSPRTHADFLKKSQVLVYDKNKIALYEARDEASYNGLMNAPSPTKPVSTTASSRHLAQIYLEGEKQDILWPIKRELVALRVRAAFSPHEINALKTVASSALTDSKTYKRAPFATEQVLWEAKQILGPRRFKKGGFIIYSTIDLALYNSVQGELLTKMANGDIPDQKIIVTEAPDGTTASINSSHLPTVPAQFPHPIKFSRLISRIAGADGHLLYLQPTNKINLSKGGDLRGN